jgi:hypothetical protein
VIAGAAPLVAVTIALIFLGEPLRAPLAVGAVLIVAGGLTLMAERVRPDTFRFIGLAFSFACTILFATRDNVVRWLTGESGAAPLAAAAASLLGGALVAVGGVALLGTRPLAVELAGRPFALAAVAVVLGVAGAAYQLGSPRDGPPSDSPRNP